LSKEEEKRSRQIQGTTKRGARGVLKKMHKKDAEKDAEEEEKVKESYRVPHNMGLANSSCLCYCFDIFELSDYLH
jgi:hypothetical protein